MNRFPSLISTTSVHGTNERDHYLISRGITEGLDQEPQEFITVDIFVIGYVFETTHYFYYIAPPNNKQSGEYADLVPINKEGCIFSGNPDYLNNFFQTACSFH